MSERCRFQSSCYKTRQPSKWRGLRAQLTPRPESHNNKPSATIPSRVLAISNGHSIETIVTNFLIGWALESRLQLAAANYKIPRHMFPVNIVGGAKIRRLLSDGFDALAVRDTGHSSF